VVLSFKTQSILLRQKFTATSFASTAPRLGMARDCDMAAFNILTIPAQKSKARGKKGEKGH